MKGFALIVSSAALVIGLTAAAPKANAQVSVGVQIGPAPVCPYGYYAVPPYQCAPYGYYGPEWFTGGVFIGAGPWFHGPERFEGRVDNRFHPEHGYRGRFPDRGERRRGDISRMRHFRGNESRDGRGHVVEGEHRR